MGLLFFKPPHNGVAGESFDAPNSVRDATLIHDLADSDVSGAADVRAAAQFATERSVSDRHDANLIPYFSPNSAIAPVLRASSMLITLVRISMLARIESFINRSISFNSHGPRERNA